jgi:hypothetical protein
VKWSVFFKQAFTKFSNYDGAWASLRNPIPDVQKKRREYFLGHQRIKPSVQSKRQGIYKSIFFMSQLPDSPYVESSSVEGEEEVNYDTRPAKRFKSTADFGPAAAAYQQQQSLVAPQQAPSMMMVQAPPRMSQNAQQVPGMAYPGAPPRAGRGHHSLQPTSLSSANGEYDLIDLNTKPKSSMDTKQFLLHFLSSELLLGTRLHGDFTCTRSEFSFWSPSLPHSTIRSVLSFFKLSKKWLGFFHKFLEAPLKFIEDGPSASTRPRKRGVPGAHALSSVCGEVILFCMDYAVNQHTNGAQLYRMHDDFWIWSSNHETVVKGWEAITKFSDVMGVTLNKGKTGTVRIMKDQKEKGPATIDPLALTSANGKTKSAPIVSNQKEPALIHPTLPVGEIRWGFLYMDPLTGKFVIDQEMVDQHILELQRQLQEKDKSIFSWIQAWNTYAGTFFKTNFGKPANIFGREHVDMILSTMTRIQKQIFSDSNVVEYLKSKIHERFGIEDIPDGYLYFPTSLGGLELQNPFIGLVQVRDAVFERPTSVLDDFLDAEIEAYRKAKLAWERGQVNRHSSAFDKFDMGSWADDGSKFMTFEEFTRCREEFAYDYEGNLLSVFDDLLEQPGPEEVNFTVTDELDLGDMDNGYMRWVAQLYGQDMIERFGGLNIVEKGLLPMGMVTLFRSGRVKWQE